VTLEEQIAASPDAVEAYLVLADQLLEKGDPLGELIRLQHALATGQLPEDGRAREAQLTAAALGSLAQMSELTVIWHLGFIRDVTLVGNHAVVLPRLLALPATRFLRSLIITSAPPAHLTSLMTASLRALADLSFIAIPQADTLLPSLVASRVLPSVRRLAVTRSGLTDRGARSFVERPPRHLEKLYLDGNYLSPQMLKRLKATLGPKVVEPGTQRPPETSRRRGRYDGIRE
jgi:uncharacterized protein (TIGR02996 family)